LLPTDAVPWVPELFFVECGAVLRRWDLNRILTRAQIDQAIEALMGWPLRVTQVRGLFADAWRLRANVTFADAVYVALAAHLGADLLSDDGRLAKAPGLPVRTAPARLTADPSRPSRQTPRIAAVRFGAVAR
jgi:predicted nucleic acid-binding protein